MKLTWLGHACFLLEHAGYSILLDPYTGVEGYPPLGETAARSGVLVENGKLRVNKVLCSHQHFDHNAADLAELLPEAPCPFSIRTVETFHDGQGGALRGSNTIHILSAGGFTAAHLGDLGHLLSPEQVQAIGPLDAALVPVGGYYTIGAEEAKAVCAALNPRRVIPMHYCHAPYGLPVVGGVEEFLSLWPAGQATRLDGPAVELDGAPSGVLVPKFQGKAYRYILFDLDGTLTDSREGILHCVRETIESYGDPVPPEETLLRFIGPPLQDSFIRFCGYSPEKAADGVERFRLRYEPVGQYENLPAPGMAELMGRLRQRGLTLALASSKPENLCRSICARFGFTPHLSALVGSPPDGDWEKEDVVREAMRQLGLTAADAPEVLMVGDRKFDVLGARACGVDCAGVEFFGYAPEGELQEAGAVTVAAAPEELESFILAHSV